LNILLLEDMTFKIRFASKTPFLHW